MIRDIAIIGMNGRFPKANNIDEFEKILKQGVSCIDEISAERRRDTVLGHKQFRKAAFLDDVDKFDHSFFGIAKAEANLMDPNQRILLEVVYGVFENAGYNIEQFSNNNTGVFVACSPSGYHQKIDESAQTIVSGNLPSMIAGRISRFFNLTGNAVVVDTACSSSLVALNQACNSIQLGEIDHAIVGASSINLFPAEINEGIDVGIFSPSSKVSAFSVNADGTVGGEACAAILLKPLDKALDDNDHIHAVIKSVAVNQDANRSSFITAPSKIAQEEVIVNAWEKAKIDPLTVQYVEAHGTGTKIGDPIEFEALTLAFKRFTLKNHFCYLSSVKTNIGHTDAAAGLVGLIKAVLSVKNKVIYPSLNYTTPNPLINTKTSALTVNDALKSWAKPSWNNRRAGVSSFGFSGTNCHVIIEESPTNTRDKATADNQYPFTISSNSLEGLDRQKQSMLAFLEENSSLSVRNICYTLAVGRTHYPFRYSLVVNDTNQLINDLKRDVATNRHDNQSQNAPQSQIFVVFPHWKGDYTRLIDQLTTEFAIAAKEKASLAKVDFTRIKEKRRINCFVYHFCLFKILESYNLNLKQLIGIGIGEVLIDLISKTIDLEEAIKRLAELEDVSETDELRLSDFIYNKIAKEQDKSEIIVLGEVNDLLFHYEHQILSSTSINFTNTNGVLNSFTPFLINFYQNGSAINWSRFFGEEFERIELPLYQFKKNRCWFKSIEALEPIKEEYSDLTHQIVWEKQALPKADINGLNKHILVFSYEIIISQEVIKQLKSYGYNPTFIYLNVENKNKIDAQYVLNNTLYSTFKKFRADLESTNKIFEEIVFFGPDSSMLGELTPNKLDTLIQISSISYFNFLKAFSNWFGKSIKINFVTFSGNKVLEEEKGNPFNNITNAIGKSILSDYPEMSVKVIDLSKIDSVESNAKQIIEEINATELIKFVSYRNNERYIQKVKPKQLDKALGAELNADGVYLISGGLSGLGFELAKRVIRQFGVKELVILGRALLNENIQSDQSKIKNLQTLRELNATVHYFSVDLGDFDAVGKVMEKVNAQIYRLDGVFHLAGLPGNRICLEDLELDEFQNTLGPKIIGTLALNHFTWNLHPKFFVCFSSLNAIVPLKNSLDYTIANGFQDDFANFASNKSTRFYSINWPGWELVGMSAENHKTHNEEIDRDQDLKTISVDKGFDVLFKIIGQELPQLMVGEINWTSFKVNPFFVVDQNQDSQETDGFSDATSDNLSLLNDFSTTEKTIWSIWYEVLKEENINLDSDFFEVGGNSLNGIQVINAITAQLGHEIEFEDIFDFPTIKEMASYLDSLSRDAPAATIEEIHQIEEQYFYGISSTQKRFWMLDRFGEIEAGYNLIWACELIGVLEENALKNAIDHLIDSYEILRTTYDIVDNEPVQIINPVEHENWVYTFYNAFEKPDQRNYVNRILKEDEQKKFDLHEGPLVRATLIKLEPTKHIFSLAMPHIATDAWSTNLINNQIRLLYNSFANGGNMVISPPKIQYKDFASWQNALMKSENFKRQYDYWSSKFHDHLKPVNFPTDFDRPSIKSYEGDVHQFMIAGDSYEGFCELAHKTDVSHFMLLLAIVKLVVFKYTNQHEIVIGTAIAGRTHFNLEDQLGCFLNMLPLKTTLIDDAPFATQLTGIKKTVLEAFEHQHYPFDLLVKDLEILRVPGRMPMFDITIGYQDSVNIAKEQVNVSDLQINAYKPERLVSTYDLSFDFIESENGIYVEIEFDTKLFVHETIRLIQYRLLNVLDIVMQNYNLTLSQINDLLLKEEQDNLNFDKDLNLDEAF